MKDFAEVMGVLVAITVVCVLLSVGTIVGISLTFSKPACENLAKLSERETFYSLGTGCLVKVDGAWVDSSVMTSYQYKITIKQGE